MPRSEAQSGHPVRSQYTTPGASHPRKLPDADAIIVAPATYNAINKWAQGISDTYALGILAEAPGLDIPVVVLPFVNAPSPPTSPSAATSRNSGMPEFVSCSGPTNPTPPAWHGRQPPRKFPWQLALDAADGSPTRSKRPADRRRAFPSAGRQHRPRQEDLPIVQRGPELSEVKMPTCNDTAGNLVSPGYLVKGVPDG